MEQSRSKKISEAKREKTKKKNAPEKKTKSDVLTVSSGSLTDPSLDSFYILGKGYGCGRSKTNESGLRLFECYSEAKVNSQQDNGQNLKEVVHCEGLHPVASNSSFLSAKSDLTEVFQKQIIDLEDKLLKKNLVINTLKKQLGQKEVIEVSSAATETDESGIQQFLKLKDLEKKILNRDRKIKELNQKVEECYSVIEARNEENSTQSHKISLLNRQLQSMYELLGKQKWNSIDPAEFAKYKNKTAELESAVSVLEEEKGKLFKKIQKLSSQLENKEMELNAKNRELVEYKNRSTLEMCRLINEIDFYEKEAKNQKLLLDSKVLEVQTSMEDEIVNITKKLEEQYQKDVATSIEKHQANFERLASLPKTAIEQLLRSSQSDKMDFVSYQKQLDAQQALLESKIESMEGNHTREVQQLKDSYESKVVFLKTQIEALQSQLKERKDIIDIFENELMVYKTNSSMNLLKASTLGDDITALKDLYTSEIFSQKQIHKLQLDIFEEKVKTLTEEILFHAKSEELQMQELERAKAMATVFREKYELLVFEWEKKIEKDFKTTSNEAEFSPELESTFTEFKNLMETLKKSEKVHEERIKMLETKSNEERISFLQDIEGFKEKLQDFAKFQNAQSKLDETIQNLVKAVGVNYSKTVEALLTTHMTEVSLKHMELCASEKRHIEEIDGLKNDHEKEVEELRHRAENLNEAKIVAENELASLRKISSQHEIMKKQTRDISVECMKSEGMIAIKEETEKVLMERIKELEDMIQKKEENCRKELEDLMAKYMKAEILASSKDDLAKELEDKLNETETRLEKSYREIDRLTELCSQIGEEVTESEERSRRSVDEEKFREAKTAGESLERNLIGTFERLEEDKSEKRRVEEERKKVNFENNKIKKEMNDLAHELRQKEKILEEMQQQSEELLNFEMNRKLEFEAEKNEILEQVTLEKEEKEKALKQNEILENKIHNLDARIDTLTMALSNNADVDRGEVFSISLQEVRFLYEEEQEVETSVQAYQTNLQVNVLEANEKLRQENEALKLELQERGNEPQIESREDIVSKIITIQEELRDVTKERDELLAISESLGKERMRLREEVEKLQEENLLIRSGFQSNIKETRETEMNTEIGKLTDYIKTLSSKLEVMKSNNELLLSESREHLKNNQDLVSELEEAWSQRYEIEDQLMKVRKENALLNMHRRKLEETNERISRLISESKPSVASWIKIHETVENIVDEVLALKTSFSDSGSVSGASTVIEPPRTNSELRIMTETLHTQLKNKTMLCDELIVQKESLEKELKNLEKLLQTDLKLVAAHSAASRNPDTWNPEDCFSETHDPTVGDFNTDESMMNLKMLKKRLQDQVQLEEEQFRENLVLEIEELKKEIQKLEEDVEKCLENEDVCLKAIESKYEEDVAELSKEFEKEVERLKETFQEEDYGLEIEKLKKYFEGKWADLEKRYREMYKSQKAGSELKQVLQRLQEIFSGDDSDRQSKLGSFVKDILSKREEEVKSLQEKYEEAVAMLETKHDSEVQKLQSVVLQLKENIMTALKKETGGEEEGRNDDLIGRIRKEYEEKLEEEKKKLSDLLEDARLKHERDIVTLEEFWMEKLSECETKCAMMKATGGGRKNIQTIEEECGEELQPSNREDVTQALAEGLEEKQIVKYGEPAPDFDSGDYVSDLKLREDNRRGNICVSCLTNQPFYKGMELKTDDDKLDVIQQKNTLEEMIFSMRNIITKLLTFVGQQKSDALNLSNSTFDVDDTMYKSIHVDLDRTASDVSVTSNSVTLAKDLSTIFQEIKENSLLNSSDQVRFELERCLKQLKHDATSLLALSCPVENSGQSLAELVKRVEIEKRELEEKVMKVEEMQKEMKREISTTRERLSQWERNLEVVSEGYGEEIVEPKQIISLTDVREKLKTFLSENCGHSQQDINLLEEICKEGDRLQKEWLKEKCDLQQQGWGSEGKRQGQIDVADKQVHSLKKFLEEQAVEREQEREAFDREISELRESLKAKERDSSIQNRTNREVEALVSQVKELTTRLTETEKSKEAVEGEFQNAVKKIWSLREVIQDLELQLAEVCERECNLKRRAEKLEGLMEQQSKAERNLKEELETFRTQTELKYTEHIKSLEEELVRLRHVAEQVNPESLTQLKASLRQIEGVLIKKTKDLEQLHVSSANVSCSSPSEDVSIRDQLDATRCSTPDEMCGNAEPLSMMLPMEEVDRVQEKLARHTRAEEVAMKYIQDLKMQLRTHRKAYEEVQTERDVLLEKVDGYLKENSGLKVRLEEQRCNAGLLQKQLNANLESQINRLEVDVEKLNEMCNEKDKQLRDMKVILENTKKSLKVRETEALNKSKEENALIVTLKTDLANALNENEKLEESLEKTREKLRESLKMPALIDSMLEEKNAEIDRLEKEVVRLSSEKNSSGGSSRGYNSEVRKGQKRRIRFSEPDSFSENISSISVHCLSDLRNCSDSYTDFRNSSFKTKRNAAGCSTKLESISSIAPLQLSPRGPESPFNWKTSSPILQPSNSPSKTSPDLQQMEDTSKLQQEIDSKRREISELHLEIDKLKRRLVESNQEMATAKSLTKEIQTDLAVKEEEIRSLKNNEESLLLTINSLKKNHAEEVEELENKIKFEHGKVETVYEEIKALEVKKIEIEEAFLSLREDYNEKINEEKKAAEGLVLRIRSLEARNGELEVKLADLGRELEKTMRESESAAQALSKEIVDLKNSDKIRSVSSQNAETQVEGGDACVCRGGLTLEMPKMEGAAPIKENLSELKSQFEKMAAVIGEKDFNKRDAFLYAVSVRELLNVVLKRLDELTKEVEAHMKKVMECSVDDLALKVQRELVLSAKLDNQLLSSIEANGYASNDEARQLDSLEGGGGDASNFTVPKPLGNAALVKVARLYRDATNKMRELVREREELRANLSEQQKIIRLLEESLRKEKDRILEEKDRCAEDAKIMELLRVNLEKRMQDVKVKERELRKEKQARMALEKEVEGLKKANGTSDRESKKVVELTAQLEAQKEKLLSVGKILEEERKKNHELELALEEERIERISEKNARRMVESDLSIFTEEKENLKREVCEIRILHRSRLQALTSGLRTLEHAVLATLPTKYSAFINLLIRLANYYRKLQLLNSRELLHSRNVEIGLLKRKINLQEIDIKALSVARNPSETSSLPGALGHLADLELIPDSPTTLLLKMKKLNSCIQRHVRESSGMGETLLQLGQETEQMRDLLRRLEENETKVTDETLLADVELERKLWGLERGKLVMEMETIKRENEILKRDLAGTSKSNEALILENSKLKRSPKKEDAGRLLENGLLQSRVSHLNRKYMKSESHRKSLIWQKNFLKITLEDYRRSEEEAWRKIGRRRRDGKKKPPKPSRFRVVALAIISIFRMKYVVKKWQRNTHNQLLSLLETQTNKLKSPIASVLNIYNEPVNPLSYQTQNIFRRSSQVLRTPPSRDPGPESFTADPKNVAERLEEFDCRHDNSNTLKGLP